VARARASLDGVRRVRNTTFVKCLVFYAQRDIFETRRRGGGGGGDDHLTTASKASPAIASSSEETLMTS
jgi:hypothetical protein